MTIRGKCLLQVVAALAVAALFVTTAGARDPSRIAPPPEKTYAGTVEEVTQHRCEICHCVELSLILKTDNGRIEARLGPQSFFAEHDYYIVRGDSLTLTGIPFTERGKNIVLANEVRRGGEYLVLRGKFGKPMWLQTHGHTCPVCGN